MHLRCFRACWISTEFAVAQAHLSAVPCFCTTRASSSRSHSTTRPQRTRSAPRGSTGLRRISIEGVCDRSTRQSTFMHRLPLRLRLKTEFERRSGPGRGTGLRPGARAEPVRRRSSRARDVASAACTLAPTYASSQDSPKAPPGRLKTSAPASARGRREGARCSRHKSEQTPQSLAPCGHGCCGEIGVAFGRWLVSELWSVHGRPHSRDSLDTFPHALKRVPSPQARREARILTTTPQVRLHLFPALTSHKRGCDAMRDARRTRTPSSTTATAPVPTATALPPGRPRKRTCVSPCSSLP